MPLVCPIGMDTLPMPRSGQFSVAPPAPGRRDRELLAAYRRGDRSAAERLVDRTYEAVFASLVRLCGDRELAADLAQETYRKAWQSLDSFEGRSKVSTWLYRIAYTTFLNQVRGGGRTVALDEQAAVAIADPRPSSEERLSALREREATRLAVLGLPRELRYVIAARYWGDLPVREIARDVGVTPVAIRKRIKKALGLMARALEEVER